MGWRGAMLFCGHLVSRENLPGTSMAYANNQMTPAEEKYFMV
jgi:hypothetical protein